MCCYNASVKLVPSANELFNGGSCAEAIDIDAFPLWGSGSEVFIGDVSKGKSLGGKDGDLRVFLDVCPLDEPEFGGVHSSKISVVVSCQRLANEIVSARLKAERLIVSHQRVLGLGHPV